MVPNTVVQSTRDTSITQKNVNMKEMNSQTLETGYNDQYMKSKTASSEIFDSVMANTKLGG